MSRAIVSRSSNKEPTKFIEAVTAIIETFLVTFSRGPNLQNRIGELLLFLHHDGTEKLPYGYRLVQRSPKELGLPKNWFGTVLNDVQEYYRKHPEVANSDDECPFLEDYRFMLFRAFKESKTKLDYEVLSLYMHKDGRVTFTKPTEAFAEAEKELMGVLNPEDASEATSTKSPGQTFVHFTHYVADLETTFQLIENPIEHLKGRA